VTDLVSTEYVGNRQQDCIGPTLFLGPVGCTQSIILTAKGGSAVNDILMYFMCFFGKKHAAFK